MTMYPYYFNLACIVYIDKILNYLCQLFSVKLLPDMKASSFKSDQKVGDVTSIIILYLSPHAAFYRSNEVASFSEVSA